MTIDMIGLVAEKVVFRTTENRTVRRWGMPKTAGGQIRAPRWGSLDDLFKILRKAPLEGGFA